MRLVYILLNPQIRTGGHRRYIELASGMAGKGHEVFLIKNRNLKAEIPAEVRCINLDYNYKKLFIPYSVYGMLKLFFLRKTIRKQIGYCDFITVFGETHLFPGMLLNKILRSALVFAYRSNGVEESRMYLREGNIGLAKWLKEKMSCAKYSLYEKIVGRFSGFVVFQSEFDRASYLSRVPAAAHKSYVIRGNIGEPWYSEDWIGKNHSTGLEKIIYLGSLNNRKGIKYLVEAFAVVKTRLPDFSLQLHIFGSGFLENDLRKIVADSFMENCVFFHGKTDEPFKEEADSDLVVVPSLFDSYPNVVLEALHVGTPVIAAKTGGIPDILNDEELMFEPGSAPAIAEKIVSLCNDKSEYARVRELCGRRVKHFHFDWAACWEDLLQKPDNARDENSVKAD